MSVSDSGLITWTALEGVLTSGLFTLTVFDGEFIVDQSFEITVTAVNDAPLIISVAPASIFLGDEYLYTILVEDPDDNEFTITIENEPDGMALSESGFISWTPTEVGEYGPITITVSDEGEDNVYPATEVFTVNVVYNYVVANYGFTDGNNLISFYSIPPEDQSVDFVFDQLGDNISYVFGEDQLAYQLEDEVWVGSLQTIKPEEGYWVNLEDDAGFVVYGLPTGSSIEYSVHAGNNLLSYSYDVGQDIEDALPNEIHNNIYAIFGQNLSALNINGMWIGSLNSFEPGKGYWYIALDPFEFNYNAPEGASFARSNELSEVPSQFSYDQSRFQSFYYIKDLDFNVCNSCPNYGIEPGDWIVAYNEDTVVGAREWNGEYVLDNQLYIDVPVMGYDIYDEDTAEFCQVGDVPTFKLYKKSTNELIELVSNDINEYSHDRVQIVSSLSYNLLPMTIKLSAPYPNPFNPSTTIEYEVPLGGMNINVSIYDIRGRLVVELVDGFHASKIEPYKILWNAHNLSSGIYFVRLKSDLNTQVQKISLIK